MSGVLALRIAMGILTEEMKSLVRGERLGFVATVAPDGSPNLSPKGSTLVWDDDHLVFADVESPRTIRNLVENPRVEINVVDPFRRKGFRFKGTAVVLRSGAQYWKILEMYRTDGADIRHIRAIILVEVKFAAPLVSPLYSNGAAEEEVESSWEEYRRQRKAGTAQGMRPRLDI
jgi:uncharacterized protein